MTEGNRSGGLQATLNAAGAYLDSLGRRGNLFRLGAEDAAFLAVDMQNFVCRPAPGRELPGMEGVIRGINRLADFCHVKGIPVIWLRQCFTRRGGGDDAGLYGLFHSRPLDPGMFDKGEPSALYPGMHLDGERDFVVEKNRYSAFAPGSSRLETLLAGLGRTRLILGGVAANVCVESTARDAMQRGYEVTVLSDATTAFDDLVREISLLNIRLFFGDVRKVDDVIRELGEPA